jgi:acyl dehydratase
VSEATTVRSKARTITESDILTFAGFTGDYASLHVDEEYARTTPFGGRILHGNAILSIACGLLVQTGTFDGHLGMLGMELRFTRAVRPGDTIHAELREISSRVDSTGAREVVVYDLRVADANDETVLTGVWTQLRPHG